MQKFSEDKYMYRIRYTYISMLRIKIKEIYFLKA